VARWTRRKACPDEPQTNMVKITVVKAVKCMIEETCLLKELEDAVDILLGMFACLVLPERHRCGCRGTLIYHSTLVRTVEPITKFLVRNDPIVEDSKLIFKSMCLLLECSASWILEPDGNARQVEH
jgi:hypothetical protein